MMPWYPGDFMRSTRGWSVSAKGVYRELLDAQWDMGGLPVDPAELAELIRATPAEWKAGWSKCESKFPISEDGLRRNARLETHRSKAADLTERRRKGADKTNAQRHGQRPLSDTQSVALNGSVSDALSERSAVDGPSHASISRSKPSPNPYTHSESESVVARAPSRVKNGAGPDPEKDAGSVCVDFEKAPGARHASR